MQRTVQPELLDVLPPDDPRAVRSRRDLRRVNAWMRNPALLAGALLAAMDGRELRSITDIGAGDGGVLLDVGQRISSRWKNVSATLVDRQKLTDGNTHRKFAAFGWRSSDEVADVFEWANQTATEQVDAVIANLFLHHFGDEELAKLLRAISKRTRLFAAIEPGRSRWALFATRWLWLIGCNRVTRHDAVVSVRGGFSGTELSALWPAGHNWTLTERRAGLFSHLFVAQRKK